MLKSLLGSFLIKEKISTTEAKAKELKMISEKIISQAKKILSDKKEDSISSLRLIKSDLPQNVTPAVIKKIAERFVARKGGYVRIIKKGARKSDSAKMAVIEMVSE